jgi:hypothetical protein
VRAQGYQVRSSAREVGTEENLDRVGRAAYLAEPVAVSVVQASTSYARPSCLRIPPPAILAESPVLDDPSHNPIGVLARRWRSARMRRGDTAGHSRKTQRGELVIEGLQSRAWPVVAVSGGEFCKELQPGQHRG